MHLSKQVSMRALSPALPPPPPFTHVMHGLAGDAGDTCARAAATAAPIADDVAASLKSAHGRPDSLFEMTTATPPVSRYIIRTYIYRLSSTT